MVFVWVPSRKTVYEVGTSLFSISSPLSTLTAGLRGDPEVGSGYETFSERKELNAYLLGRGIDASGVTHARVRG